MAVIDVSNLLHLNAMLGQHLTSMLLGFLGGVRVWKERQGEQPRQAYRETVRTVDSGLVPANDTMLMLLLLCPAS